MKTLFAQTSPEVAASFFERLPDILKAVASNPLGYGALILIVIAVLAAFLFGKAHEKARLAAFAMVIVFGLIFCGFVIHTNNRLAAHTKPAPGSAHGFTNLVDPVTLANCSVSGFVYNEDLQPAKGIQNVKLAYVPSGITNPQPVQVATTDPKGRFAFNCSQIKREAFPIRLRATFRGHPVESEDHLFFGENTEVSLYISPAGISNHYRLSRDMLRINSAQLLRSSYTVVTNTTKPIQVPVNAVLTVPKEVLIRR